MNWEVRRETLDQVLGPLPPVSMIGMLGDLARSDEDLVETARRVLIREALERSRGRQDEAATLIRTRPPYLSKWWQRYLGGPDRFLRKRRMGS